MANTGRRFTMVLLSGGAFGAVMMAICFILFFAATQLWKSGHLAFDFSSVYFLAILTVPFGFGAGLLGSMILAMFSTPSRMLLAIRGATIGCSMGGLAGAIDGFKVSSVLALVGASIGGLFGLLFARLYRPISLEASPQKAKRPAV